jgi:hypothetical protein
MSASIFKNVMKFFGGEKKNEVKTAVQLPNDLPSLAPKPKSKVFLEYQGDKKVIWSCQLANAMKQKEVFLFANIGEKDKKIITYKLRKTCNFEKPRPDAVGIKPLVGLGGQDLSKEEFYFAVDQTKETLEKNLKNGFRIVGLSSSDSHCDGTRKVAQLWHIPSNNKQQDKQMDPKQMINMIKSGTVDFLFMQNIFGSIGSMLDNPMLKSMGFNITDDMKEKIKLQSEMGTRAFNSMTKRERKEVKLLTSDPSAPSRIQRISKGSGVAVEDINKYIEMLKLLRSKGGNIAELMSNPGKIKEIMSKLAR